jgi:hypothetical protein
LCELVDQVAVRAVNFNAIEASANGILCGSGVRCHVLFDFIRGECTWHFQLSRKQDG